MICVDVLPILSVTRSKRLVRGLKSNHDRGLPKYKEIRETKLLRVHRISLLWPYSPVNNNFTNVELVHLQINSACVGAVSSIITLGPDPTDFGDYGQL
jgi:hypothetical protein